MSSTDYQQGKGTLHIVGLGPGSADLLTVETRALLSAGMPVILRTRHHPTVIEIDAADAFSDCDDLYAAGMAFEQIYEAISVRVLDAAIQSETVYAVPGHPLMAERSVQQILTSALARGVSVSVHGAVSYADLAAVTLGIDMATLQLCDALELRIDTQRPALISQLYDRDATAALKLRLLDIYPADHTVTVLGSLGTAEVSRREVALAELDHKPFGYLDCLYVPPLLAIQDLRRFDGLYAIIERLHAPDGGCPWDLEQTHVSLRPHLLEESYEALEAIDSAVLDSLTEELGDVLLQVLMHSAVAERTGEFSFADVSEHIAQKLIRRHPHVFGDATANSAEQVTQNWEALKQAEKPKSSILEGVPSTLPALAASQSIQGRARRIGFEWPDIEGPLDKLAEEIGEFARANGADEREDEFGDVLFVIANIARRLDIDAEQALRRANGKFRRRFGTVERLASDDGLNMKEMDLPALDALWDRAKALERSEQLL
ncbi:MAG: nucleoside triphosphate pyrophosphohydrolase [Tepidiformaceae bacterium]